MKEPIRRKVTIEHIYDRGMWRCEVISVLGVEFTTRLTELKSHAHEIALEYISLMPELEYSDPRYRGAGYPRQENPQDD